MRSFKTWVLVLAAFFGLSLVSGARAIAEEATMAAAPAVTTTAPAEKTEKPEKKHHKKKPGVKKKHKKAKATEDATAAPGTDSTTKS